MGLAHIAQPLYGNAVTQQFFVVQVREQRGPWWLRLWDFDINRDLLDPLAYLDQLSRASRWMRLQLPTLGPGVGLVMMIDVTQQKTRSCFMNDQPNITARTHRPEILILGLVEPVKSQSRTRRIEL